MKPPPQPSRQEINDALRRMLEQEQPNPQPRRRISWVRLNICFAVATAASMAARHLPVEAFPPVVAFLSGVAMGAILGIYRD